MKFAFYIPLWRTFLSLSACYWICGLPAMAADPVPFAPEEWRWRHPHPDGRGLRDVTWRRDPINQRGQFIAVGESGKFAVSADGATWTYPTVPVVGNAHLTGVAVGIKVDLWGQSPTQSLIVVSEEGRLFSGPILDGLRERAAPLDFPLYAIAANERVAIAVGGGTQGGRNVGVIYASRDGLEWLPVLVEPDVIFVAAACNSDDRQPSATSSFAVASEDGRILFSTDGMTFDSADPSQSLQLPEMSGRRITALANAGMPNTFLATSDDGRIFTLKPGQAPIIYEDRFSNDFTAVGLNTEGTLAFQNERGLFFGKADDWQRNTRIDFPAQDLRAGALDLLTGDFVMVGDGGVILRQDGGSAEWAVIQDQPWGDLLQITSGPQGYCAAGWDGIFTSPDGFDWQPAAADLGGDFMQTTAYFAGKYLVAGSGGKIWYSYNLSGWISRDLGATVAARAIATGDGLAVMVANYYAPQPDGSRGVIYVSGDGLNWDSVALPEGLEGYYLEAVEWNGSAWRIIGRLPTGSAVFRSTDGVNWEDTGARIAGQLLCLASGGGWWVAGGREGLIAVSQDGDLWAVDRPALNDPNAYRMSIEAIAFAWDSFYAVSYHGSFLRASVLGDGSLHGWRERFLSWQTLLGINFTDDGRLFVLGFGALVMETGQWPERLRASDGLADDAVALRWDPLPNAVAYQVERADGQGWQVIAEHVTASQYIDASAAPGQSYGYRVRAEFSDGQTGPASLPDQGYATAVQASQRILGWGAREFGTSTGPTVARNWRAIFSGAFTAAAIDHAGNAAFWGAFNAEVSATEYGSPVASIALGNQHHVLRLQDGSVVGLGNNDFGQIAFPANLPSVQAVAASANFSILLYEDGSVAAFGALPAEVVAEIAAFSSVKAIAAAARHGLVLFDNGQVAGWGDNFWGQLDLPDTLPSAKAIAAGDRHSAVIFEDGRLLVLGDNSRGQLEVPDGIAVFEPADAPNAAIAVAPQSTVPGAVRSIDFGIFQAVALTEAASAVAWGEDHDSQSSVPEVAGEAIAVAAGAGFNLILRASDATADDYVRAYFGEAEIAGDWANVAGLGWVVHGGWPWVLHPAHQWLYCGGPGGDFYFSDATGRLGWMWSTARLYPFLWIYGRNSWLLYLEDTADPRWFFDYGLNDWISLD